MMEDANTIFKALSRGANGYLVKGMDMDTLEARILNILEGREAALTASVSKTILGYFQKISPPLNPSVHLSEQEMVVARYLIDGLAYDEIAQQVGIGVNGIRYHVKKIYAKLGINSRHQLRDWVERT
jgi:DNA-binding NarL/FixJ family response regulator